MQLENSAADNKQFFRTLLMINAVENVSMQSQSVKPLKYPQLIERLYVVCDQMVQADSGVHKLRDGNSTPCETEPGPYIGQIGVLEWETNCLNTRFLLPTL